MTAIHLGQLAAALLAALTPWLVVRTAAGVAARHAAAVGIPYSAPPVIGRLGRATAAALTIAAALSAVPATRGFWTLAAGVASFIALAVVGLVALAAIDSASRPAREVTTRIRSATLRPRRVDQFIPLFARVVPYLIAAIGVSALVWRLSTPLAHRQLFVPLMFAGAAIVFLWLYEVWIANLVRDPAMPGENEQRRATAIRLVYAGELALVTIGMGLAHALLDAYWPLQAAASVTLSLVGALAGVIGCAFAVASDLTRRSHG